MEHDLSRVLPTDTSRGDTMIVETRFFRGRSTVQGGRRKCRGPLTSFRCVLLVFNTQSEVELPSGGFPRTSLLPSSPVPLLLTTTVKPSDPDYVIYHIFGHVTHGIHRTLPVGTRYGDNLQELKDDYLTKSTSQELKLVV